MNASAPSLHALLDRPTAANRDKVAVVDPGSGSLTYGELDELTNRLRDRLALFGARTGERVGLCLHKSIDSIASVFGIMKTGGAYVPVDADAPAARCAYIFNNCDVRAIICDRAVEPALRTELEKLGRVPPMLVLDDAVNEPRLSARLRAEEAQQTAPRVPTATPSLDDTAYILYTSGSTGQPKGVTISHRAALAFVDWCSMAFEPNDTDVFSSHAPLHFDLSIHDIYVSLKHGATLVLVSEETGKDPLKLAPFISDNAITIWYSTPSILSLIAQYGKTERHDYSKLRIVHFAGEVFPIPRFRALHAAWPHPRYFNLYGPTETNVCTYHECTHIEPDRTDPFPIGKLCEHYRGRVIDENGADVAFGEEGELIASGIGVMQGYWHLPELNARVFIDDANGVRWYRTGDLVVETKEHGYVFHGRRDRMVKRRGYRIELGEIEAGLARHPQIREVAVIATTGADASVKIRAFLGVRGDEKPSTIQLKQFCMENLPTYMVPDQFTILPALPRTSTDKIDYQTLKAQS